MMEAVSTSESPSACATLHGDTCQKTVKHLPTSSGEEMDPTPKIITEAYIREPKEIRSRDPKVLCVKPRAATV
jgi:hypothetical protein